MNKVTNKWIIKEDYVELYIENMTYGNFTYKIDLEDYERCSCLHWNIKHASGKYSYKYYGYTMINKKPILLHRFIMGVTKREDVIDHINKDGATEQDNRKYNLRICTLRQNLCNIDKRRNNTSGYKGVTWNKTVNKWMAYIKVHYKFKNLGYFENIDDAVKARVKGEEFYFGEYSRC